MRHLIVGTSILSVTLALLSGYGYPVSAPFTGEKNLVLALFVAAIVNLTITVPAIAVAFHTSVRWWSWIGLLAGAGVTLSILELLVLCIVLGSPPSISRAFLFLLQMNLTQCFVLVLSLLLVRWSGYQLRLVRKDAIVVPITNTAQSVVAQSDPWSEDEENID